MNRQWVSVVSVLALVVLAAPTSGVVSPPANDSNNTSLGTEISSFMQVSSVEASSDVDQGMFEAQLAGAPNDSVRQRLLERRADRLETRLGDVRRMVETAQSGDGPGRTVAQTVANARVDALERSVVNVETVATRVGTSPPGLSGLREDVRGLREPSIPPVIDTGDEVDLAPPPAGGDDGSDGGDPVVSVPDRGGDGDSSGAGDDVSAAGDGDDASLGGDAPAGDGGVGVEDDGVAGPAVEQSVNGTTTDDANALDVPLS